jgi:hypothetical protein
VRPEGDTLRLAAQTPLFDLRGTGATGAIEQYARSINYGAEYDILPDGKRFVMVRGADTQGAREIVLVQNWFSELQNSCEVVETNNFMDHQLTSTRSIFRPASWPDRSRNQWT